MTRQTPIKVVLTAEQIAVLLRVLENGERAHPVDAEFIALALRKAVANAS